MPLDIDKKYFVFAPDGDFQEILTLDELHYRMFESHLQKIDYEGNQFIAEGAIWAKECEGMEFYATDMNLQDLTYSWLHNYRAPDSDSYDFDNPPEADHRAAKQEIAKALAMLKAGF